MAGARGFVVLGFALSHAGDLLADAGLDRRALDDTEARAVSAVSAQLRARLSAKIADAHLAMARTIDPDAQRVGIDPHPDAIRLAPTAGANLAMMPLLLPLSLRAFFGEGMPLLWGSYGPEYHADPDLTFIGIALNIAQSERHYFQSWIDVRRQQRSGTGTMMLDQQLLADIDVARTELAARIPSFAHARAVHLPDIP